MNSLIYRTLFYVNIYVSYKLSKTVRFWPTLYIHTQKIMKVDNLSRERMCAGSEFQVVDAETENVREIKLLVIPEGTARRFVLEESKALDGW